MSEEGSYYIPKPSYWPFLGCVGLFTLFVGAANWIHHRWYGEYTFSVGFLLVIIMMFGWFGAVIKENQKGVYDAQVDRSFRWGMIWFIFSEVCFFLAFFGALFYTRVWAVPILGGEYYPLTHYLLWPNFKAIWPLAQNPNNHLYPAAKQIMDTWGLPAINTLILLSSGVTLSWAHWGLKENRQRRLIIGLTLTVILGVCFLLLQAHEYATAYQHYDLTLASGIYGSTFFMLTGFHGAHVTIGTIMLFVILIRSIKGHFSPHNHFAFEAVAWYWHFVDVVWLCLFVFVYWL